MKVYDIAETGMIVWSWITRFSQPMWNWPRTWLHAFWLSLRFYGSGERFLDSMIWHIRSISIGVTAWGSRECGQLGLLPATLVIHDEDCQRWWPFFVKISIMEDVMHTWLLKRRGTRGKETFGEGLWKSAFELTDWTWTTCRRLLISTYPQTHLNIPIMLLCPHSLPDVD
jgi:hypothetical protein